jgi:hypothetical protein
VGDTEEDITLDAEWADLGLEATLAAGETIARSFDDDLESWSGGTLPLPRVAVADTAEAGEHDLHIVGVADERGCAPRSGADHTRHGRAGPRP